MVVGGIEQYACQGRGSLSGFSIYMRRRVSEMAKSVNNNRANIIVSGCLGNSGCRTILLAPFFNVLHNLRSRVLILRGFGFRCHRLRMRSLKVYASPGLASRGEVGPPSTSEMDEDSRCDGHEGVGDDVRKGVGAADDSEDERANTVSTSLETRLSANAQGGVSLVTSSCPVERNSYASFDG